jgi:hypothetical protein
MKKIYPIMIWCYANIKELTWLAVFSLVVATASLLFLQPVSNMVIVGTTVFLLIVMLPLMLGVFFEFHLSMKKIFPTADEEKQ